jgi:hypothetical protein
MRLTTSSCPQDIVESLFFPVFVAIGLSLGCGESSDAVGHLSGEVTLDGQPLLADSLATVSFQPIKTGGRATSAPIVDSRYDSPDVPKGEVLAYIRMSIPTGRKYRDERTGKDVSEQENVVLTAEEEDGIEVNVVGDEMIDFDLHRAKRRGGTER